MIGSGDEPKRTKMGLDHVDKGSINGEAPEQTCSKVSEPTHDPCEAQLALIGTVDFYLSEEMTIDDLELGVEVEEKGSSRGGGDKFDQPEWLKLCAMLDQDALRLLWGCYFECFAPSREFWYDVRSKRATFKEKYVVLHIHYALKRNTETGKHEADFDRVTSVNVRFAVPEGNTYKKKHKMNTPRVLLSTFMAMHSHALKKARDFVEENPTEFGIAAKNRAKDEAEAQVNTQQKNVSESQRKFEKAELAKKGVEKSKKEMEKAKANLASAEKFAEAAKIELRNARNKGLAPPESPGWVSQTEKLQTNLTGGSPNCVKEGSKTKFDSARNCLGDCWRQGFRIQLDPVYEQQYSTMESQMGGLGEQQVKKKIVETLIEVLEKARRKEQTQGAEHLEFVMQDLSQSKAQIEAGDFIVLGERGNTGGATVMDVWINWAGVEDSVRLGFLSRVVNMCNQNQDVADANRLLEGFFKFLPGTYWDIGATNYSGVDYGFSIEVRIKSTDLSHGLRSGWLFDPTLPLDGDRKYRVELKCEDGVRLDKDQRRKLVDSDKRVARSSIRKVVAGGPSDGDSVKAKCEGSDKYYDGKVVRCNGDDTFEVKFSTPTEIVDILGKHISGASAMCTIKSVLTIIKSVCSCTSTYARHQRARCQKAMVPRAGKWLGVCHQP
jgi:hypothetical protein